MQREITPELRQQIFALYWGQYVLRSDLHTYDTGLKAIPLTGDIMKVIDQFQNPYLELKSLSDITDEDAIEVAKYATHLHDKPTWKVLKIEKGRAYIEDSWTFDTTKNYFVHVNSFPVTGVFEEKGGKIVHQHHYQFPLHAYDYLRSKGYALPAMGFTVQELIDAGVYRIKNKRIVMENKENGWVIINIGHPSTGLKFVSSDSFRRTKRQAIKDFVDDTTYSWQYWRSKWNFRCVKAESIIKTKDQ